MAQAVKISSVDHTNIPSPMHGDVTPPAAPQTPKVNPSGGRTLVAGLPLPTALSAATCATEAPTVTVLTSTNVTFTSVTSTSMITPPVTMTTANVGTASAITTGAEPAPAARYAELMVKALMKGRQSEFKRQYNKMKGAARAQARALKMPACRSDLMKEMLNQTGQVLDRLASRSMTPLMAAARMDNLHALALLLRIGADPNLSAELYGPPLMLAQSTDCIQRPLDAGADVNAQSKLFGTVLSRAIRENLGEAAIRALLEAGADVNQLAENSIFAQIWNILMTPRLHGLWIDAHEGTSVTASALMVAADKGAHAIIRLLLEHGADPELRGGPLWDTALMIAVTAQHPKAVQALLDGGAKVNAMAKDGSTALYLAAARNNRQLMQMLIDAGALVDQKDALGVTALMRIASDFVEKRGCLLQAPLMQAVAFLIENGADPSRMVKLPPEGAPESADDGRRRSRRRAGF